MSKLLAFAVPILPGKEEDWRKFVADLDGSRKSEFLASRKKLKVRERVFSQHTPMGDMAIVTLEGEDPQSSLQQFSSGDDDFTKWFVGKVKELHNFDLTQPPTSPMPEMVADSGEL